MHINEAISESWLLLHRSYFMMRAYSFGLALVTTDVSLVWNLNRSATLDCQSVEVYYPLDVTNGGAACSFDKKNIEPGIFVSRCLASSVTRLTRFIARFTCFSRRFRATRNPIQGARSGADKGVLRACRFGSIYKPAS